MIEFRQKIFFDNKNQNQNQNNGGGGYKPQHGYGESTLSYMAQGAGIGGALGLGTGSVLGENNNGGGLMLAGAGTVLGAALGLLYGLMKEKNKKENVTTTVNSDRLLTTVVENLKKTGFKEGRNFTRDPKTANELKTKVCIVVTRTNGDLKLLVNTVSDFKLKQITDNMVKTMPNSSTVTKKMSDRFNDVTISSISDSSADAGLITGIAEHYIRNHYPVYLVEVG